MKFYSPKKLWEIPKNIIKTTEAIGSISYSRATYSEILKIFTIMKYMQAPWKFEEKYDVILITQLKAMFLEISETLKVKYSKICENISVLLYQCTRQLLNANIRS